MNYLRQIGNNKISLKTWKFVILCFLKLNIAITLGENQTNYGEVLSMTSHLETSTDSSFQSLTNFSNVNGSSSSSIIDRTTKPTTSSSRRSYNNPFADFGLPSTYFQTHFSNLIKTDPNNALRTFIGLHRSSESGEFIDLQTD